MKLGVITDCFKKGVEQGIITAGKLGLKGVQIYATTGEFSPETLNEQKIEEYNDIIILRHNRPDLDALGSQLGLSKTLKHNFPNKNIYVTGDMNNRLSFIGQMDEVSDETFTKSLVIICDVAVKSMMCDPRYTLAKEIFIIDHHKNLSDITDNVIIDPTKAAAAQYIAEILLNDWHYEIPKDAATALYGGIISDSGRFQYSDTNGSTLRTAAKLLDLGADMHFIYDNLYVESLESKQMKGYFSSIFKTTENNVAYLKNTKDIFEKFPVDFFTISRGMVNVMAGIEGINIWCNLRKYRTQTNLLALNQSFLMSFFFFFYTEINR